MGSQTLTVAANGDDGFWSAGGTFDNSLILDVVGANGGACNTFHRFLLSTTIPAGSTITQCDFKPYSVDTVSDTFTYTAKFQNTTNATQPSSASDLNGRSFTSGTAFVNTSMTNGAQFTHNLISELQSIVTGSSLTSGNGVLVACVSQASPSTNRRFSSKNNGSNVAQLVIAWTDPPIQITASAAAVFSVAGALKTFKMFTASRNQSFVIGGVEVQSLRLLKNSAGDEWNNAFSYGGTHVTLFINGTDYPISFTSGDFNTFKSNLEAILPTAYSPFDPPTVSGPNTVSNGTEFSLTWPNPPLSQIGISITSYQAPLSLTGSYPIPPAIIYTFRDGGTAALLVTRELDAAPAAVFDVIGNMAVTVQVTATAAAVFTTAAAPSLLFHVTAEADAVFDVEVARLDVYRGVVAAPAAVFSVGPARLGTIVEVTASAAAVFNLPDADTINYCRLFSRAQFITYITAHPDFIRPLNATAAAVFTTSAPDLQFKRLMTATATVSWTTAGNVATARSVTAAPAAVFTVSGVAGMPIHATAEAAAVFVTTSPLSDTHRALTALAAATFETGEPLAVMPLTATASPVFAVSAAFAVKKRVTATSAAVFAPVAFAGVKKAVSANPSSLFTVTAAATFTHPITATAALTVLVTATQNTYKQFTAAVAGSFQTNQPLMKVGLRITATAAAVFDLPSTPGTIHKLFTSTAAGSFTPVAFPSVKRNFSASISFDVLPIGSVSVTRSISSQADAVFSIAGIITNRRLLTANPTGIFQTVAALDVFRGLSARVDSRFIVRHLPLEVNPLDLADIWKLPPRDWVFVLPGSDQ